MTTAWPTVAQNSPWPSPVLILPSHGRWKAESTYKMADHTIFTPFTLGKCNVKFPLKHTRLPSFLLIWCALPVWLLKTLPKVANLSKSINPDFRAIITPRAQVQTMTWKATANSKQHSRRWAHTTWQRRGENIVRLTKQKFGLGVHPENYF